MLTRIHGVRRGAVAMVAAPMLLLAACGSSTPTSSSSGGGGSSSSSAAAATADPAAQALVPAAIKSKGTLTVAADASYAPDEFFASDGTTVVGMDADFAKAIGAVLGLTVKVTNVTFADIIPGLQANKYDLGMSSFTDSKDREKTVDFVTYFTAGTSFFVKASGGPSIQALADLCGHHVSVEKGTTEETDAQGQATACTAAGKPAVDVQSYPDQSSANLALTSGRADVGMADSPVAAYQVKQSNGVFKVTGPSYGNAPYGIAMPKGNGMAQAVLAAVKDLMSNGTYAAVLNTWGIQSGAITNPQINGATS
jgi:polar amino acid transport system substrate-binding protein